MSGTSTFSPTTENTPIDDIDINAESIERLMAAADVPRLDDTLLASTINTEFRTFLETFLRKMTTLNVEQILKTQNPWSRLTGADIEARLQFELSVLELSEKVQTLAGLKKEALEARQFLADAWRAMQSSQKKLSVEIQSGRDLLKRGTARSDELRSRFVRQLEKIVPLYQSQSMAMQQMKLSAGTLGALIKRAHELETNLLPIWQHNALAVSQSPQLLKRDHPTISTFINFHDRVLRELN